MSAVKGLPPEKMLEDIDANFHKLEKIVEGKKYYMCMLIFDENTNARYFQDSYDIDKSEIIMKFEEEKLLWLTDQKGGQDD